MATNNAAQILANNNSWLLGSAGRNFAMPNKAFTQAGQVIDLELESVPGWVSYIDLDVYVDLAITVAAGGTAPSLSPFAPWNLFQRVELSLGGGPFQNVSPFFYFLRECAMNPGWDPSVPGPQTYSYASDVYSVPAVNAPAGATTDNYWLFGMRIPLQVQHGSAIGFLPLGAATTVAKLRLTVQPQLVGSDAYMNPLTGGANATVAIGTTKTSYVQPNINYRTTPPNAQSPLPNPTVGYVLNVQEASWPINTTGTLMPMKFKDPFKYLRLWHIVMLGGSPDTTDVTNFEFDYLPGYAKDQWTSLNIQSYFVDTRRRYRRDLPVGVFVEDLWAGSDPANPNGSEVVDATVFQTMQTQLAVSQTATLGTNPRVITYAEALAPVAF